MNSHEEAQFRLDLAEGYLREAEEEFKLERWWATVANAQLTVENAGKAVVALFEPVEKLHDPSKQLAEILSREQIPDAIAKRINALVGFFPRHGHGEHIKATYGEDKTFTPPWKLFTKPEAKTALSDARKSMRCARFVFDHRAELHKKAQSKQ
jgi:HEPN domain-containing protein